MSMSEIFDRTGRLAFVGRLLARFARGSLAACALAACVGLLSSAAVAAETNLIKNPGFETMSAPPAASEQMDVAGVANWTKEQGLVYIAKGNTSGGYLSGQSSLEGTWSLGFVFNNNTFYKGSISQEIAVPEEGLYKLSYKWKIRVYSGGSSYVTMKGTATIGDKQVGYPLQAVANNVVGDQEMTYTGFVSLSKGTQKLVLTMEADSAPDRTMFIDSLSLVKTSEARPKDNGSGFVRMNVRRTAGNSGRCIAIGEFYFYDKEGRRQAAFLRERKDLTAVTSLKPGEVWLAKGTPVSASESADRMFDGKSNGSKLCAQMASGDPSVGTDDKISFVVCLPEGTREICGYNLGSTDDINRDPVSWLLEYSADGLNWKTIDEQDNVTCRGSTWTAYTPAGGMFPVSIPQEGVTYIADFSAADKTCGLVGGLATPTAAGSVGIWFRINNPGSYTSQNHGGLICLTDRNTSSGPMALWMDGPAGSAADAGKVAFQVNDNNAKPTQSFVESAPKYHDGDWHFAVGTYDAATKQQILYVDGEEVAKKTFNAAAMQAGTIVSVGSSTGGAARFFTGSLTEASYWSRALTAAEVATIFERKTRLTGKENGLWLYWPMDEAGSVLTDASGNQRNGTYSGNVVFNKDTGPFVTAGGMFAHPVADIGWAYGAGSLQSTDGWELTPYLEGTICRFTCKSAASSGILDTTGLYDALVAGDAGFTNMTGFAFGDFGAKLKNVFLAGGDWLTELPSEGFVSSLTALTNVTVVSCRTVTMKPKAFSSVPNLSSVRLQLGGSSAEEAGAPFFGCTKLTEVYWLAPAPSTPDVAYFKGCGANKVVNYVNNYGTDWENMKSVTGLAPTSDGTWQPTGGEAQSISYLTFFTGGVPMDQCLVSYTPKTTPYLGMAVGVSVTVRLGSRLLKEGVDYTVTPVGTAAILNPGEYVVLIAATDGSPVYGSVKVPVTVLEGEGNGFRSDMFARLVPDEKWHYENGVLWSDTGWYFVPEKVYEYLAKDTPSDTVRCNMVCDQERTTGKALETGKLDTTGVYEALTNGDWEAWHDVNAFHFGGRPNIKDKNGNVNTYPLRNNSLNFLLKELYIGGGTWMKYMAGYGLSGVYTVGQTTIGALSNLEGVTIVSMRSEEDGGLMLRQYFVNGLDTMRCRLKTLRIKARAVRDIDDTVMSGNTLENIYWNCPPPTNGKQMQQFFGGTRSFNICNWVSVDYLSDWQKAAVNKTYAEITPFSLTERGIWRTRNSATSAWSEQYIQAYDFTVPIGFTISIF